MGTTDEGGAHVVGGVPTVHNVLLSTDVEQRDASRQSRVAGEVQAQTSEGKETHRILLFSLQVAEVTRQTFPSRTPVGGFIMEAGVH